MKLNKFIVGTVFASAFASFAAMAAYTGTPTNGTIEISGELVNSACGLSEESSPVKVNFYQIPVSNLKNGERAGNVKKNIELQGCDTTVAQTATVTYTPSTVNPSDASLAAFTSGTASGAGIGLRDNGNKDVVWGQASTAVNLTNGKTTIPFVAYLKSDNPSNAVTPGSFDSTINFQVDYQ
ncbi:MULTISPECIES: fimbrial protein [Providencia]|uniref:PapA family protein n=1 Tax=Providencia heimbachae ATCC 35613 TaxID=1354272 RepID=A0A1B7JWX0_9GAMM|nr:MULTISPECIES: fimbrial protein [Providencia]MBP6123380.1 fimbrial protein [Providencia sp.]NIH24017.1 fimbrial protein [Providencia heimbachae]OAT52365.1 PapA family protein [Providencia heimbachae ATCC 35613]QCJ71418.1 fimbrial protein [Providencia heimbachae]SQH14908.1 Major fimbrial subunit precursor [Providencia heimbachae]